MNTQAIVSFCALECYYQGSGEKSVGWMFDAWLYAEKKGITGGWVDRLPNVGDVIKLGQLVEPKKNYFGLRSCGVQVGWDVKPNWETVPRQLENLMEAVLTLTPAEFFKEYEEIHPFVDGNGRTGQILFNWLNGTLHNPVFAPNFWADPRRDNDS